MINFNVVDFSERRSEEVIGFFWRSVYIMPQELMRNNIYISEPPWGQTKLCCL